MIRDSITKENLELIEEVKFLKQTVSNLNLLAEYQYRELEILKKKEREKVKEEERGFNIVKFYKFL